MTVPTRSHHIHLAIGLICLVAQSIFAQTWFTPMVNSSGQFGPSGTNIMRTNILSGTNIYLAIGTNGEVTVNVYGISGGSSLVTNANQFGASTTLTIKSGALVTNIITYALTNDGPMFITNGDLTIGVARSLYLQDNASASVPLLKVDATGKVSDSTYTDTTIANILVATNLYGNTNRFIASDMGKGTNLFFNGLSLMTPIGGVSNVFSITDTNGNIYLQVPTNFSGVVYVGTNAFGRLSVSNNASVTNTSFSSGGNIPSIYLGAGGNTGIKTNNPFQALSVNGALEVSTGITNLNTSGAIHSANNLIAGTANGNGVRFGGMAWIVGTSDLGVLKLWDNNFTSFKSLHYGGDTAAFPAIGRTNGNLVILGGDDLFAGANTNSLWIMGGGIIQDFTVAAPASPTRQGAVHWSDGTNLCVVFRNGAGTLTTNKLSMTAWP